MKQRKIINTIISGIAVFGAFVAVSAVAAVPFLNNMAVNKRAEFGEAINKINVNSGSQKFDVRYNPISGRYSVFAGEDNCLLVTNRQPTGGWIENRDASGDALNAKIYLGGGNLVTIDMVNLIGLPSGSCAKVNIDPGKVDVWTRGAAIQNMLVSGIESLFKSEANAAAVAIPESEKTTPSYYQRMQEFSALIEEMRRAGIDEKIIQQRYQLGLKIIKNEERQRILNEETMAAQSTVLDDMQARANSLAGIAAMTSDNNALLQAKLPPSGSEQMAFANSLTASP